MHTEVLVGEKTKRGCDTKLGLAEHRAQVEWGLAEAEQCHGAAPQLCRAWEARTLSDINLHLSPIYHEKQRDNIKQNIPPTRGRNGLLFPLLSPWNIWVVTIYQTSRFSSRKVRWTTSTLFSLVWGVRLHSYFPEVRQLSRMQVPPSVTIAKQCWLFPLIASLLNIWVKKGNNLGWMLHLIA